MQPAPIFGRRSQLAEFGKILNASGPDIRESIKQYTGSAAPECLRP